MTKNDNPSQYFESLRYELQVKVQTSKVKHQIIIYKDHVCSIMTSYQFLCFDNSFLLKVLNNKKCLLIQEYQGISCVD